MKVLTTLAVAAVLLVPFAACSVEQTEQAELPKVDVDVDVESGNLPKFDVDAAEIEVGMETKTVEVPVLEVKTKEVEVKVPDVDIDMPDDELVDDAPDDDHGDS